jgi:hypothetical protein
MSLFSDRLTAAFSRRGFLAVFYFWLGTSCALAECLPERLDLQIYKYGGVTSATEANFSVFYDILSEKLKNLPYEAGIENIGYLRQLRLRPERYEAVSDAPSSRVDDLRRLWRFQKGHLLLLDGILYTDKATHDYWVTSSIFWGDIRPPELAEVLHAKLPVSPEGYEHARDSHSMITLFALAMDARSQCDNALVLELLQKALEKAQDLERDGQLTGDLVKVKASIENQISLSRQ